jgi:8-oxo-dGTP pyrophosphatase MutT (NUDIX family)
VSTFASRPRGVAEKRRILTTDDVKIGRVVARLRSKALVWIARQGPAGPEVLLLQRPPRRGGGLHPVTGKAENGEEVAAAAAREAEEETGLTGDLLDLGYFHEYVSSGGKRFREHAFLLRVQPAARAVALSDEHDGFAWLAPDAARAAVSWPAHREALDLALARLAKAS